MDEYFPDVVPLIGKQELKEMWVSNPRGALITIKASILLLRPSSFVPCTGWATLTQSSAQFSRLSDRIHSQAAPYHYKDRGLIIGDAAHSQVPFYGQGLNCGLEDVRVLDYFLQECKVGPTVELNESEKRPEDEKLSAALAKYTETRHEDLVAICDMAMRQ